MQSNRFRRRTVLPVLLLLLPALPGTVVAADDRPASTAAVEGQTSHVLVAYYETVASLQRIRRPFAAAPCAGFSWLPRAVVFVPHVACPRRSVH